MDRKIFFAGQIPLAAQFMAQERNEMIGIGFFVRSVLGIDSIVDGLDCTPTAPTSLNVIISAGSIYELRNVDAMPFGSLQADTRAVMKQGINLGDTTFTMVPPVTIGNAVNVLIQAQLAETDSDPLALAYVNVANPSVPFTGPGNSGAQQNTTRKSVVSLVAKTGIESAAGTQATPAPDDGYIGLYSITVAYGATAISAGDIKRLGSAPFIYKKLPEIPAWVQGGSYLWCSTDTGSANAIVSTVNPAITSYTKGQHFFVKKSNAANSGNLTANFGPGAVSVLDMTGAQIGSGNAGANYIMHLVYDGANLRWINGNVTNTTVSSITAVSGEGITVDVSNKINLNYPGLDADVPTALDLFSFFDNEGAHHKKVQWQTLLALILAGVPVQTFDAVAPVMLIEQRRANKAACRVIVRNAYTRRPLTDITKNEIDGASLAGEQITLPAGRYRTQFCGNASNAGLFFNRLFNVSNNTQLAQSTSADSHPKGGDSVTIESHGVGHFTLASASVIELQTYMQNNGGGETVKMGDGEDQNIGNDKYHIDGWIEIVKEA